MKISLYEMNSTLDTCRRNDQWSWRYRMTNYPKWSREKKKMSHWKRKKRGGEKNRILVTFIKYETI